MDTFESAVHNNKDISKAEKMNYLVNLLEGAAQETVKGLSLNNSNYDVALDLLKERFGDEQVIVSAHINSLLNLEVVASVSDIKGLRRLCDKIEGQVRCLEAMGLDPCGYGPLLIPVILTKIPEEIKLIISRKFGKGIWDAKAILEILNTELHVRERLSVNSQNENSEKENHPSYSAFSLYSNSNNHKMFCLFCRGTTNHKTV